MPTPKAPAGHVSALLAFLASLVPTSVIATQGHGVPPWLTIVNAVLGGGLLGTIVPALGHLAGTVLPHPVAAAPAAAGDVAAIAAQVNQVISAHDAQLRQALSAALAAPAPVPVGAPPAGEVPGTGA